MTFRKATLYDMDFVYIVRNAPEVRCWCGDPKPLNYVVHREWFMKLLDDGAMFILSDDKTPRGYIRAEMVDQSMYLAYAVHPEFHRKGYGRALLECIMRRLKKQGILRFCCWVKNTNTASLTLLASFGFHVTKTKARGFRLLEWVSV